MTVSATVMIIVFVAAVIALIAKDFYMDAKNRKRHIERVKAYENFSKTIENLKVDVVEFESLKRHIRMLLTHLDAFEEKLDQYNKPFVISNEDKNLDLDELKNQVKQGKLVISDTKEKVEQMDDKSILEKIIDGDKTK